MRAALTDQDVAREHILAAEFLDAQTLGMRIAAVASTAACFFVCHVRYLLELLLSDDRRDLHIGVGLPMVLLALVMLAAAKLDDRTLSPLP